MIDKELEEKAQHYADCVEKEYNIPERIKRLIKSAYIVGANERLTNVWHSADEVPTGEYEIICQNNEAKSWACNWKYVYQAYSNWNEFTILSSVKQWAYVSELLPKGGEE